MEDIRMTDQKAQYAQLKPELDAAFSAVMGGMDFSAGNHVLRLAQWLEQHLQVKSAAPCTSGTAALLLALQSLRLPKGAGFVVPAFADASVPALVVALGLTPVLADVLPDTFTIDPASVANVITPATAAILPVHLFGQCAPMDALLQVADKYNLRVVEDATQAFGAAFTWPDGRSQLAGALGHSAATSFYPAKPLLREGEGAAALAQQDLSFSDFKTEAQQFMEVIAGEAVELNALQAAMLEVKVKYVVEYNAARQQVAAFYDAAFAYMPQVHAPARAPYSTHTYQQYAITVAPELRDGLQEHLRQHFIPSVVYYPQPLHLQPTFAQLEYKQGAFPVAERLSRSLLSLPMHAGLKQDQLAYICRQVQDFMEKHL